MADQHYHQDSPRDSMSQRCSPTAQPPTNSYPDLTSPPYSITTFTQPQHSEPHLLTPVSGVGSPSLQQSAKMMQQYPPATASMYQSSPPSSSRMLWTNSFDMTAPHSQAASPMPMNPATTESHFEMGYIPTEAPLKDEIPEPPVPYFGAYGVSGQQEPEHGSLSPPMHSGFYMSEGPMITPMMPTPDMTMPHQPMGRPLDPSGQVTFHSQPPQNGYQPQHTRIPDRYAFPSTQINRPAPNRGRQPRVKRPARMRNRSEEISKETTTQFSHAVPSQPKDQDLPDQLIIKDNCPPEERFLFTRRYELEGQKGGGIWETIRADYNQQFNQQSDIPRLQMMVTRGRPHYLQWSEPDTEHLRQAMCFVEQQYWKMVYHKFKEIGGGGAAHWGLADVEHHAVELDWASHYYEPSPVDPTMNIRRRKKLNSRRRSTATTLDSKAAMEAAVPMTPDRSEHIFEEILVERGIGPEDEDDEAMTNDMQHVRLAQRHMEPIRDGDLRAARQKTSAAAAKANKSRSRVQRTRAA